MRPAIRHRPVGQNAALSDSSTFIASISDPGIDESHRSGAALVY